MAEHELDARGLICPLPVLKARKRLAQLKAGDILRIRATDKAAAKDFQLYCAEAGHILLSVEDFGADLEILVECGGPQYG